MINMNVGSTYFGYPELLREEHLLLINSLSTIFLMEFPPDWEVLPMADFTTASPRNAGDYGMELLAQVRPNGRILDHYRITLGGSKILDVNCQLSALLLAPATSRISFKYSVWPRDVEIRRNMTTAKWADIYELLATRAASVLAEDGSTIPHEALLEDLVSAGRSAAVRFAVVVGEDSRMQLQLQALPGSANLLSGKPVLRG